MNNYTEFSTDYVLDTENICLKELNRFILHNIRNKSLLIKPCNVFKDEDTIIRSTECLVELTNINLTHILKHEDLSCEAIDLLYKTRINITEIAVNITNYFECRKEKCNICEIDLKKYITEFYQFICCNFPANTCYNIDLKNRIPEKTIIVLNRKILTQLLFDLLFQIYKSNHNPQIKIIANRIKKSYVDTVAITIIDCNNKTRTGRNSHLQKERKYIGYSKSERLTLYANLANSLGGKFMSAKTANGGRAYILLLEL